MPVINALTDDHHPCQALADLLTLRERFGGLEGLQVAYVGDGNNVAHSLIEAAALAGFELWARLPARLPARRGDRPRRRRRGARRPRSARSGRRRPRRLHRRLGLDGRRGRSAPAGSSDLAAYRVDRDLMALAAARRGVPALPARPPRRGGRRRRDRRAPQRRVAAGRQPPADRAGGAVTPSRPEGRAERCVSSSPSEATRCCGVVSRPTPRRSATTSPSPSRRSPSSPSRTSSS